MLRQGENAIEGERFPVQVLKRQVRQCEDPDGVRRNAEVIFAAGTELRAVVRDGPKTWPLGREGWEPHRARWTPGRPRGISMEHRSVPLHDAVIFLVLPSSM
eukprot:g27122.t1